MRNSPPTLTSSTISTTYQHYIIERGPDGALWELGRGGMGVTYKARDTNLDCSVALKIIGPQCFGGEESRRRFVREAQLAAQIRHPNVAAIYHLDQQEGEYFYSMEFVDGVTAEAWVKEQGPMPVELALDVAMQITRALTAADRLKLVHRDIKPANVMLLPDPADRERVIVKVIDFGLARLMAGEPSATMTTCGFVGTPQYASPEQVESLELDIRSDIYSLGCTLWHFLVGQAPFVGSTARVIAQHLTSELPTEQLRQVPSAVRRLLRRMLAKSPEGRPQTPVELHAEICACRENLSRRLRPVARVPDWFQMPGGLESIRARDGWLRRVLPWAGGAALLTLAVFWLEPSPDEVPVIPRHAAVAAELLPEIAEDADVVAQEPVADLPSVASDAPDPISEIPGLPPVAVTPNAQAEEVLREPTESEPPPIAAELPPVLPSADLDGPGVAINVPPPNEAEALDLTSEHLVALSPGGLVAEEPAVKRQATKRPSSKASSRSRDRRASPIQPVDRVRRTVESVVRRIF